MANNIGKNMGNAIPIYRFNSELWKNLSTVLCCKNVRLAEVAGVSRLMMHRWQQRGDVSVQGLVNICNNYCIRVSSFVGVNQWHPLTQVVGSNQHYAFEWHAELMQGKFGTELSKYDAQRELKCRWSSLDAWTSSTATIQQFLHICNTLRWNAGEFLTDKTLEEITEYRSRNEMELEIMRLKREIARLKREQIDGNETMSFAADAAATYGKEQ